MDSRDSPSAPIFSSASRAQAADCQPGSEPFSGASLCFHVSPSSETGGRRTPLHHCLAASLQKRMGEQGGNSRHNLANYFSGGERPKGLQPGGDELVFEPFAREGPTQEVPN